MTDLLPFTVEIPYRTIATLPLAISQRVDQVLGDRACDIWKMEVWLRDCYVFTGHAPREVVTLLMALAQGHDVEAVLSMIERDD